MSAKNGVRWRHQVERHVGDFRSAQGRQDGTLRLGQRKRREVIDEQGLPSDEVAIAEAVLGINEDKT